MDCVQEVDAIILQSLREIGCNLEDDVKLKTLTPEEIFLAIGKLLKIIKPDSEILNHLPAQIAQRFAAASQLVDCCKSLGFNGDLGYQTILYSNPIELRRIFMWLIEHIPKSEDKIDSFHHAGEVSESKAFEKNILRKLASDLKRPRVLEFLQKPSNTPLHNFGKLEKPEVSQDITDDSREFKWKFTPTIFHQTLSLMPSVVTTHDNDLFKKKNSTQVDTKEIAKQLRSSAIRSSQSLNLTSSPTKSIASVVNVKEDEQQETEKSKPKTRLEILAERIEQLKEKIEDHEDIYRQLTADKKDQKKSIANETKQLEVLAKEKKLKMQVAMLLDEPEESKHKLKQSLEAAAKRRENLNIKFESHKQPLEEHLETFTGSNSVKLQRVEEKISSIKAVKQKILEIQDDVKNKTQAQQQLLTELSQMKRSTERSAYTSRIVDIVKSIKKQNNDINEVLKDTKSIQKSINNVEGQLTRQFTVTEDLIWNNTNKKDEYSKKAYKFLILLHTEFSELVALIENTGSIQREIRDLEDQIDNERQHNVHLKLEQITKDLEMIASI